MSYTIFVRQLAPTVEALLRRSHSERYMPMSENAIRAALEGRCEWISVVAANAEEIHDRIEDQLAEVVDARLRALGFGYW